MDHIISLLSPEQVDTILTAYDSVGEWYSKAILTITDLANSIVIEDVIL